MVFSGFLTFRALYHSNYILVKSVCCFFLFVLILQPKKERKKKGFLLLFFFLKRENEERGGRGVNFFVCMPAFVGVKFVMPQ